MISLTKHWSSIILVLLVTGLFVGLALTSLQVRALSIYSGNPVFSPSSSGWDSYAVADPSVINITNSALQSQFGSSTVYFMAYCGKSSSSGSWNIGLAYSTTNLQTWTRIGEVITGSASWESNSYGVTAPCLFWVSSTNTLYCFYGGANSAGLMSIGDAYINVQNIENSNAWVQDANNPVLTSSVSINYASLIQAGSTVYMYYVSGTPGGDGKNTLCLAATPITNFPYGWTPYSGNPLITLTPNSYFFDDEAIFTSPNSPYFFMAAAENLGSYTKIYRYWSTDGMNWNLYSTEEPYIGNTQRFDAVGTNGASVIITDSEDFTIMFWGASASDVWTIGEATDNIANWTPPSQPTPTPTPTTTPTPSPTPTSTPTPTVTPTPTPTVTPTPAPTVTLTPTPTPTPTVTPTPSPTPTPPPTVTPTPTPTLTVTPTPSPTPSPTPTPTATPTPTPHPTATPKPTPKPTPTPTPPPHHHF